MLRSGAEGTDISLDLLDYYSFREGLYLCEFMGDKERDEKWLSRSFDVLQTPEDKTSLD